MRPLEGVVVLDLSQFLSGPRCAQILALFGARVIKVETPVGDTMRLLMQMMGAERALSTIHQNKESVVIDWRIPEGATVVRELAKHADVFVENFAKDVMKRAGLGYDELSTDNPRLIYVSITGFGHTGPLSHRTAFDIIAQATGGIMWAQGQPHKPPGVFFGDLVSGAYAALGVLAALLHRQKTGLGQHIDISMQDVMYFHNFWAFAHKANKPHQNVLKNILGRDLISFLTDPEHPVPFWNSYRAKDGYIVIVALTDRQWNKLMEIIGKPELVDDERFNNIVGRIRNSDDGVRLISEWVSHRSVDEVEEILSQARIPCGKVKNFEELFSDPQLQERGMFVKIEHPELGTIDSCGFPVKMSGYDAKVESGCPRLGQDTEKVLKEFLGYDDNRISELKEKGVILT